MTLPEAWCRTYTLLVPEEEGQRRLAEVASHLHEARCAGAKRTRLALETALGAVADLTWSDRVRRRRGLAPLVVTPLLDATTGAIVAGLVVLVVFGLSALPGGGPPLVITSLTYLAATLVCAGHVAALVRRRRGG